MKASTFSHRAAVHLNNAGISLLERHCYQQAMETLSDAVTVWKMTISEEDPAHSNSRSREFIQSIVQKASRRLAQPQKSCEATLTTQVISDNESALSVASVFLTIDDCEHLVLKPRSLPSCVNVIRMESQDDFSLSDSAIEAAICLFNYSQAHICLASLEGSSADAGRLRTSAQELVNMAFTLLWSSKVLSGDLCLVKASPVLNRAVLVGILALLQLVLFAEEECQFGYYGLLMQSLQPCLRTLATKEVECTDTIAAGAA